MCSPGPLTAFGKYGAISAGPLFAKPTPTAAPTRKVQMRISHPLTAHVLDHVGRNRFGVDGDGRVQDEPSQKIAHVVRDDPQERAHPFIALLWRTRFLG